MRFPVLALAAALLSPLAHAAPQAIDRIAAVVNDGVILQSELDRGVATAQSQLKQRSIAAPADEVLYSQVLDRLITARVIYQRGQEAGIRVDDRELNEVISNIARQNNMSISQFADSVRRSGGDYLAVRDQIRDEVLAVRVRQKEVDQRMVVTDQDIDLFLANPSNADDTEYRLSHILLAFPDQASVEQRQAVKSRIEKLAERIAKGEDFGRLAAANSSGADALKGGDLGFRTLSDLPEVFAAAAAKMKKGQLSNIIETASGYHLLKLVESRSGSGGESSDAKETLARHILLMPNAIRNEDQTLALSEKLYERIQKGESLEALAKEFSEDPGSKNDGGNLGWQAEGTFVPEFQIRLDQLKQGEVSRPFHTQFGWHIARVDDRRTRDVSVEARRNRARQQIGQRKATEEYETYLRRLRDEAYVEIRAAPSA